MIEMGRSVTQDLPTWGIVHYAPPRNDADKLAREYATVYWQFMGVNPMIIRIKLTAQVRILNMQQYRGRPVQGILELTTKHGLRPEDYFPVHQWDSNSVYAFTLPLYLAVYDAFTKRS